MNKVFLIGNLTRDPELRATHTGTPVANFTLAINRKVKDKDGRYPVDYINIIAWAKLAELCTQYLAKGKKVAVMGEMQTRTYSAEDGSKRYATEVVAHEVEFLTPKSAAQEIPDMSKWQEVTDEGLPF